MCSLALPVPALATGPAGSPETSASAWAALVPQLSGAGDVCHAQLALALDDLQGGRAEPDSCRV